MVQTNRHQADSTLLEAVLSALGDEDTDAGESDAAGRDRHTVDPMQHMSVSGRLFFDSCRSLYERSGPEKVFACLYDAFPDKCTPIGVVFNSAGTPSTVTKRLNAYERLAHRSVVSEIRCVADRSVEIRRVPVISEIAETVCLSLAYWGMVASAFRAAGCRGIRLESRGNTVFANRELNTLRLDHLRSDEPVTLSWTAVERTTGPDCPEPHALLNSALAARLVRIVFDAIRDGEQVRLADLARRLGTSPRTLQRRLAESNTSLRSLQHSLQIYLATRLLTDPVLNVSDVAASARYADAPHFIRRFRAATGLTPQVFANSLLT